MLKSSQWERSMSHIYTIYLQWKSLLLLDLDPTILFYWSNAQSGWERKYHTQITPLIGYWTDICGVIFSISHFGTSSRKKRRPTPFLRRKDPAELYPFLHCFLYEEKVAQEPVQNESVSTVSSHRKKVERSPMGRPPTDRTFAYNPV